MLGSAKPLLYYVLFKWKSEAGLLVRVTTGGLPGALRGSKSLFIVWRVGWVKENVWNKCMENIIEAVKV